MANYKSKISFAKEIKKHIGEPYRNKKTNHPINITLLKAIQNKDYKSQFDLNQALNSGQEIRIF